MGQQRENWGSRFGFIMAAAGSAVGLGNIWRFPYLTGVSGGGAFIIVYLIFAIIVGMSVMLAEFTLGRNKARAATGAYKSVGTQWTFVGFMGVLTALFIMGFYPVVGGWSTAYIFKGFTGLLSHPDAVGTAFEEFISAPVAPLIWMLVYLALNIAIVAKGIAGGIEKAGKVLMPTLFILLIIIMVRGLTLPGAGAGVKFLFEPDFSKINGQVVLAALGQAFFSLSLGMGCMITYGSFLSKGEDLKGNALIVTVMDTCIAILAGLAMFPATFAYGIDPAAGPGLIFVVMPTVFANMGGVGVVFHVLFFIAFTVAALTSSISLMEVVVDYFIEQHHKERKTAIVYTSVIMVVLCILSSLSLGTLSHITFLGVGMFDFLDKLTDKVYMAIGGMLLCICVGWAMKKEDVYNEVTNEGQLKFGLFNIWYALLRYILPIVIAIVSVTGIIATPERALMILGVVSIFVMGLFSKKMS